MLDELEKDIEGDWNNIICKIEEEERSLYYDKIHILIDNAILLSKENRKRFENNIKHYNMYDYHRHFCTIKLDIGRCSGKTEYILRNYKENDAIIVGNRRFAEVFFRNGVEYRNVYSISSITGGLIYDTIWIDDYSYLNKNLIDDIYLKLGHNINQTFIFLG